VQLLLIRSTDTDETLHSCSISPEDVHVGELSRSEKYQLKITQGR